MKARRRFVRVVLFVLQLSPLTLAGFEREALSAGTFNDEPSHTAALSSSSAHEIKWLVEFDGSAAPTAPWTRIGRGGPAEAVDGALRVVDESDTELHCYRATWENRDPEDEIVVEARVRLERIKAHRARGGTRHQPWRDGSPISVLISDGRCQEGLVLVPYAISNLVDRFYLMDTVEDFHVYRMVISGNDMAFEVDGKPAIHGRDAFWRPAPDSTPFIQFGSSTKCYQGESLWDYVRLGVRKPSTPRSKDALKITIGDPWEIPSRDGFRQTRPYMTDAGEGLLHLAVCQGPDAAYEPYAVLQSRDKGKTWQPVEGLQHKTFFPIYLTRLRDGRLFGPSHCSIRYQEKTWIGMSFLFDREGKTFTMYESKLELPNTTKMGTVFERDIFRRPDGSILAVVYQLEASHLVKTTDLGRSWEYVSTIGEGQEPAVEFLSEDEAVAIVRDATMRPFVQYRSHDGGLTWTRERVLEEGSVAPDLQLMSNGVLACSYGRHGCCLMFSLDGGRTWDAHRVISAENKGFCYTSICEVSPGRLLYLYDVPPWPPPYTSKVAAVYVDVARP